MRDASRHGLSSVPFAASIPALLASLPIGSADAKIVTYLSVHAIGRANAKPWQQVSRAARVPAGYQTTFQQGVLAQSRDGASFIGAGPHGYFIIQDRADALVMARFYRQRIKREQEHLDHLHKLVSRSGWTPI